MLSFYFLCSLFYSFIFFFFFINIETKFGELIMRRAIIAVSERQRHHRSKRDSVVSVGNDDRSSYPPTLSKFNSLTLKYCAPSFCPAHAVYLRCTRVSSKLGPTQARGSARWRVVACHDLRGDSVNPGAAHTARVTGCRRTITGPCDRGGIK